MKVEARQIRLIENMSETSKRGVVSEGLTKVADNVQELLMEVGRINNKAARAATILTQIAAEEAGKGFLLVDYMRPYQNVGTKERGRHLRNVYSHLARGIYVKYYQTCPDSFAEVESIINGYRVSHYLDGPNDVDWIFRNQIEEDRERELYVDLVSIEEGLRWYSPSDMWKKLSHISYYPTCQSQVCNVYLMMQQAGLFSEQALVAMGKIWRTIEIRTETRWHDYVSVNHLFLAECDRQGVLSSKVTQAERAQIADQFLYPLCGLDLTEMKVPIEELHSKRTQHLRFMNRG